MRGLKIPQIEYKRVREGRRWVYYYDGVMISVWPADWAVEYHGRPIAVSIDAKRVYVYGATYRIRDILRILGAKYNCDRTGSRRWCLDHSKLGDLIRELLRCGCLARDITPRHAEFLCPLRS